jgi:hypothetical protein
MPNYSLNPAAEASLAQVAGKSGLPMEDALGAALNVAKGQDADALKNAAKGDEAAQPVSGRDWIRIGILVALALLLVLAVVVSFNQVAPRSITVEQATSICKASNDATASKACDPAAVLTAHETNWQASLLALLGALFAPILALFSASVGYYFGKGGQSGGAGGS